MSFIVHKAPSSVKLYELEIKNFYVSTIGDFHQSPFPLCKKQK